MNFTKLHGLGNDFILLERPTALGLIDAPTAKRLCDRATGVGADGVLEVTDHAGTLTLIIRNADGSRPEMCGNGLRCVGRYLANRGRLPPEGITVATDAGPRHVAADGALITVAMGAVRDLGRHTITAAGEPLVGRWLDVGNPHFVIERPASVADVCRLGPLVEHASTFPAGANVAFVQAGLNQIDATIWERGSGLTGACGSGACAVAVSHWIDVGATGPVTVHQPGGDLVIDGRPDAVRMTGPAVEVFSGQLTDPARRDHG